MCFLVGTLKEFVLCLVSVPWWTWWWPQRFCRWWSRSQCRTVPQTVHRWFELRDRWEQPPFTLWNMGRNRRLRCHAWPQHKEVYSLQNKCQQAFPPNFLKVVFNTSWYWWASVLKHSLMLMSFSNYAPFSVTSSFAIFLVIDGFFFFFLKQDLRNSSILKKKSIRTNGVMWVMHSS